VPRTYVSKSKNEKATPTLSSWSGWRELGGDRARTAERRRKEPSGRNQRLVKEPVIAEMLPFRSQLNGMQMSSILTRCGTLTIRPRRTA